MLNDEFVGQQARALAKRVEAACAGAPSERLLESQVAAAFRIALARIPSEQEQAWCRETLERQAQRYQEAGEDAPTAARQALAQLCHTLFNTSEFLYIE
jgi:hypothetical protein